MDQVAAAAELAKLAEQAGKPEFAKIALEFGVVHASANPAYGMWIHPSKLQLPLDSPDDKDALNSARTWQHYERDDTAVSEAGTVDAAKLQLPLERTDDAFHTARTWQHFELEQNDITISEVEDVDTVNLLPKTPGSKRTAKRHARRLRARQKHRLLQQFPQITPRELQTNERLELLKW